MTRGVMMMMMVILAPAPEVPSAFAGTEEQAPATKRTWQPLPADGGAPVKAYLALWAAVPKGAASMKPFLTPAIIRELEGPEGARLLKEMFVDFVPVKRRIVAGGRVSADLAEFTVENTLPAGGTGSETVHMKLVDGQWKLWLSFLE